MPENFNTQGLEQKDLSVEQKSPETNLEPKTMEEAQDQFQKVEEAAEEVLSQAKSEAGNLSPDTMNKIGFLDKLLGRAMTIEKFAEKVGKIEFSKVSVAETEENYQERIVRMREHINKIVQEVADINNLNQLQADANEHSKGRIPVYLKDVYKGLDQASGNERMLRDAIPEYLKKNRSAAIAYLIDIGWKGMNTGLPKGLLSS